MPPARASLATHRRRRVPRRAEPTAIQAELGKALGALADRAAAAFADQLFPHLPGTIQRDDAQHAHLMLARAAAAASKVVEHAAHVAAAFAPKVEDHSARELARQLQAATGVDIAMPRVDVRRRVAFAADVGRAMARAVRDLHDQIERHVVLMLEAVRIARHVNDVALEHVKRADAEFPIEHALHHVNLISGLTSAQRAELGAEIAAAHANGDLTRGTLRAVLKARFGIFGKRAKLIARDQVSKLNGQVDMDRQIALGITHFRWVSKRDRRVRPLHVRRHNKVYAWANPPLTHGHPSIPGSDPLCRCEADPVVADLRMIFGREGPSPGAFTPPRRT